jgi:hypothetical protein
MSDRTYVDDMAHRTDMYLEFEAMIAERFSLLKNVQLFKVNTPNLFDVYLNSLPNESKKYYTCNACKHFIARYGGLVTIGDDGSVTSAIWPDYGPGIFNATSKMLKKYVEAQKVVGVFASGIKELGEPVTGEWTHLHVIMNDRSCCMYDTPERASDIENKKNAEFGILSRSLNDYQLALIDQAIGILESDTLYRGETVLGVAKWFRDVQESVSVVRYSARDNLIWKAIGSAPAGYCHIRSTMIGTLLDDLAVGYTLADTAKRFAAKMNPIKYQRPTAVPTEGAVRQAEKTVEKLGIAKSLKRRFATVEDITAIWKEPVFHAHVIEPASGIFGKVITKEKYGHDTDGKIHSISVQGFVTKVLPGADYIDVMCNSTDNYFALLTAVDSDAPPIIQWDTEADRNPVSWYVYNRGSPASRWGLRPNYNKVKAITYQPSMWQSGFDYHGKSLMFIIDGAKDSTYKHAGIGLFPEILKNTLHEHRKTIEAYSSSEHLEGYDKASACGIRVDKTPADRLVQVYKKGIMTTYKIVSWD